MKLQGAPFDAPADLSADWIELRAIVNGATGLVFSDIERAWEAQRAAEDEDLEGGDTTFDDWLSAAVATLQFRAETLQESYPFEFAHGDRQFNFRGIAAASPGRAVYLLCLFLSSFVESEIFSVLPEIRPVLRNTFGIASAWAAAGVVNGSTFAIGWPRRPSSTFLEALREVYEVRMDDGEATVLDAPPPGSSPNTKDEGIDVVAWCERLDRCAGKVYLVGQVASGKNWDEKPVAADAESLKSWFRAAPVSTVMKGMFIPFSLPIRPGATRQQQMRFFTGRYGAMYYREVLPAYAALGLGILQKPNGRGVCHHLKSAPALARLMRSYVTRLARAQNAA